MSIWKRIRVILLTSLCCIGFDQWTKVLAAQYLPEKTMLSYLSDILRIGYTENIGAFLGLGNSLPEGYRFGVLVLAVGFFLFGLCVYLVTNSKLSLYSLIALSMVFAGGISNFYDRVVNNGAVIDFLNIGIGSVRTGVFNIADVAIMLGVLMFLLAQNSRKVVV